MQYCLQIRHEACGEWSVAGLPHRPVVRLGSLAASIEFARRECDEAPATIELMVDGFYAVIHQESGWPRRLVAAEPETSPLEPASGAGIRGWVRKSSHRR
jgi:hypothetical protein